MDDCYMNIYDTFCKSADHLHILSYFSIPFFYHSHILSILLSRLGYMTLFVIVSPCGQLVVEIMKSDVGKIKKLLR